jgi:hypothetical protein
MEKDFGKIKKNDQTDIVIRVDDFGGKPGLTVREFTTSERYTGFTKSGTRVPADKFEEFKTIINSINASDFPEATAPAEGEQQALPNEAEGAEGEAGSEDATI